MTIGASDAATGSSTAGTAAGPLAGVRVIEIAGIGPSPFCAMLLADLGAEVLRVDRTANVGAAIIPGSDVLNRGRPSIALDLKQPVAVETLLRMVPQAEILLEGFRPGVAERLGIGPATCHAVNPSLVYGRMTGYGQDGPYASAPGHDINYIALSGALAAIGAPDVPPTIPLNLVGDFGGGGMLLAVGLLAALVTARATGRGQVVDAAMTDGSALLMTLMYGMHGAGTWHLDRGSNLLDGGVPFYEVYETRDGPIAVGCLEPHFYAELLRLLGLDDVDPDAQMDPLSWPSLRRRLAASFAERTRAEWEEVFAGAEVCVAPVLTMAEAPSHPHNSARGTFQVVDGTVQPGPAPRFSATPTARPVPPSPVGADTVTALAAWGLAEDEIMRLLASGAARQADAADTLGL